jgi:hypothetical protein
MCESVPRAWVWSGHAEDAPEVRRRPVAVQDLVLFREEDAEAELSVE